MIEFTKIENCGNDYVYINCLNKNEEDLSFLESDVVSKFVKKISDRHFGIGSDGVIFLLNSNVDDVDFKMRIFNSDGSEAEMCANGVRGLGRFIYENELTSKKIISIETIAGIEKIYFNFGKNSLLKNISVDVGKPILDASKIPVRLPKSRSKSKTLSIRVCDRILKFTCVSFGNPHAVCFTEDINKIDLEKYANSLEKNSHFPNKINLEFAEYIRKDNFKMRVWERGSGETLSCGTGACAVCVAAVLNKLVRKNQIVKISSFGGKLKVCWNGNVFITGDSNIVFEGKIEENFFD
jgi:diaminopimelate epimerase